MFDTFALRIKNTFSIDYLSTIITNILLNLVVGIVIFTIFYAIWKVLQKWLLPKFTNKIDKTSAALVATSIKVCVFSIGVLMGLNAAGVQTTAVLTSLGVLSLTIGFALRDTLSNIISGFLIFIDRPFTIDDLVEIDGQYVM